VKGPAWVEVSADLWLLGWDGDALVVARTRYVEDECEDVPAPAGRKAGDACHVIERAGVALATRCGGSLRALAEEAAADLSALAPVGAARHPPSVDLPVPKTGERYASDPPGCNPDEPDVEGDEGPYCPGSRESYVRGIAPDILATIRFGEISERGARYVEVGARCARSSGKGLLGDLELEALYRSPGGVTAAVVLREMEPLTRVLVATVHLHAAKPVEDSAAKLVAFAVARKNPWAALDAVHRPPDEYTPPGFEGLIESGGAAGPWTGGRALAAALTAEGVRRAAKVGDPAKAKDRGVRLLPWFEAAMAADPWYEDALFEAARLLARTGATTECALYLRSLRGLDTAAARELLARVAVEDDFAAARIHGALGEVPGPSPP
jgi:hypothetical protein